MKNEKTNPEATDPIAQQWIKAFYSEVSAILAPRGYRKVMGSVEVSAIRDLTKGMIIQAVTQACVVHARYKSKVQGSIAQLVANNLIERQRVVDELAKLNRLQISKRSFLKSKLADIDARREALLQCEKILTTVTPDVIPMTIQESQPEQLQPTSNGQVDK